MNTISKMVLRAFLLPFLACLCILFVILIMDALALHLSSLAESGLSVGPALRLIGFSLARVVVVAISLSILAGALLGSRSLAEHHEWEALKSSGIGLVRSVKPLLLFSVLAAIFCFWFGSEMIPKANFNFRLQLYSIQHSDPMAGLVPGRFFEGIPGYVVRVGDKDKASGLLSDILIYQHPTTDTSTSQTVLLAKSGIIRPQAASLQFTLYSGSRHEEFGLGKTEEKDFHLGRTYFDSLVFRIPLAPVLSTDEAKAQFHNHTTRPRKEMAQWIDSLSLQLEALEDTRLSNNEEESTIQQQRLEWLKVQLPKYRYEYGTMLSLPLTCILFMIVGLALGAVIKSRGKGIGVPALAAVALFMVFYLLKAQGERLGKSETIDPSLAAWLPVLVFSPIALYLIWKANRS